MRTTIAIGIVVGAFACVGCGGKGKATGTGTSTGTGTGTVTHDDTGGGTHGGHDGHDMAAPSSALAWADGAALIDGLGDHHRAVTTSSEDAQAYFDQGLRLTYGFNHDEATRSFAMAAKLDGDCAMCWWGVALTLGPNYNVPMLPDRAAAAWDAMTNAKRAAAKGSAVEQALIGALAARYKGPEPLDPPSMQPFNEAYAAAMRKVAKQFPDDLDVQALFASSMMELNPWKLWDAAGNAAPGTDEIVAVLKGVIERAPNHPGANHYLIHAVEASKHPEDGVAAADRLAGGLMPAAGHIVHMPAHIYQRVGRYTDASAANRAAIEADNAYLAKMKAPGYYPMYLAHNHGFLAFSASMLGRSEESLAAARAAHEALPEGMIDMMPGMDFFVAEPLMVMVRFGKWDALLAEPRPKAQYAIWTGLWLHAHGMALAATGKLDDADKDLAELSALAKSVPAEVIAGQSPGPTLLGVAAAVLDARIAEARKDKGALEKWRAAVVLEDTLPYDEPADWFYPIRHWYGAALLAAGKAKDAEAVFKEDLARNPNNGWALEGLAVAQKKLKKTKDAAATEKKRKAAWKDADITLTTSIVP
jgi:tetratricopeptide (TPR) repeat protein